MSFDRAMAIADAVLMEGYALYPYRASAPKNRFRWTFGVIAPRAWSEAGGCEPWWLETQVLVAGTRARITGRLRCFQIERRAPARWDEGVLQAVDFDIPAGETRVPFAFPGSTAPDHERRAIAGELVLVREAAQPGLAKVTIRIENHTSWSELAAPRERVMLASLASTHVLVAVDGGSILSAIEPPAWTAVRCTQTGLYPVLVGPPGSDELALAAPFILQDHPQIAPESAGDLCDAGEIDELLALRTRTLTDDEKREAHATDPRTAEIVRRADALSDDALARMHGTSRDVRDGEMVPTAPAIGRKVRLLPPTTRTDAQDLLYAGQIATIVELREDVDGTLFLGVTVDGDPAAELHRWYGRCHYYRVDEVELL